MVGTVKASSMLENITILTIRSQCHFYFLVLPIADFDILEGFHRRTARLHDKECLTCLVVESFFHLYFSDLLQKLINFKMNFLIENLLTFHVWFEMSLECLFGVKTVGLVQKTAPPEC